MQCLQKSKQHKYEGKQQGLQSRSYAATGVVCLEYMDREIIHTSLLTYRNQSSGKDSVNSEAVMQKAQWERQTSNPVWIMEICSKALFR